MLAIGVARMLQAVHRRSIPSSTSRTSSSVHARGSRVMPSIASVRREVVAPQPDVHRNGHDVPQRLLQLLDRRHRRAAREVAAHVRGRLPFTGFIAATNGRRRRGGLRRSSDKREGDGKRQVARNDGASQLAPSSPSRRR